MPKLEVFRSGVKFVCGEQIAPAVLRQPLWHEALTVSFMGLLTPLPGELRLASPPSS